MNHLSRISLFSTCRRRATSSVAKSLSSGCSTLFWKRDAAAFLGIKVFALDSLLSRFRNQCHCFSTRARKDSTSSSAKSRKRGLGKTTEKEENDAFLVVRKGDIVGVYKSFSDCQAQIGSSICDPPVSVYKGYSLSRDTEEHLISSGLKNALYTIRASDLKDDMFGKLTPCPIQEPVSVKGESNEKDESTKRSLEVLGSEIFVEFNAEADAQANVAVNLADGQVQEDYDEIK